MYQQIILYVIRGKLKFNFVYIHFVLYFQASVSLCKNTENIVPLWVEGFLTAVKNQKVPIWNTASTTVVLYLHRGDRIYIRAQSREDGDYHFKTSLYGWRYSTFGGFLIHEDN